MAWESESRRLLQGGGEAGAGLRPGSDLLLSHPTPPPPPGRLQMTEAALALSEQKAQDLGELLATAEQERQSLAQKQAKEHRLEQQVGGRAGGSVGDWRSLAAG